MANVDAWDVMRDARRWPGGRPIVAHPPCRAWSAFTSHQAKPEPGERELGMQCAEWLRRWGGVLEQPAHSRLFDAAGLPRPGQRRGDLFTVEVWQAWWGYTMRKATWLCVSGVDMRTVEYPWRYHQSRDGQGDRRRQQLMSHDQRAETCPALAEWLVALTRRSCVQWVPA